MVMLSTEQQPYFPVSAEMPETKRHLEQRTLLYQVLKLAFAERAAVGCDQFVYWEPTDPRVCLAPDAFVCLGQVNDLFRFDSVAAERPLRIWERVGEQLLERPLTVARAASRVLPGFWLAIEQPGIGLALRLSHDEQGAQLFPTEAEQQRAGTEAVRAEAERRIQELEAELRRRS